MSEWKWRGRPLSELPDAELVNAHKRTLQIGGAMTDEMHRRGLFDKNQQRARDAEQEAKRLREERA